jgi:low affinity Fe/Cu permease
MNKTFNAIAQWAAQAAGKGVTFSLAAILVIVWAATGPIFNYSQTWQLVINTGTTIITFLMIFLVQNSQNRDTTALQLKLDELIRVTKDARPTLLDLEALPQEDLAKLQKEYQQIAARRRAESGEGHDAAGGTEN